MHTNIAEEANLEEREMALVTESGEETLKLLGRTTIPLANMDFGKHIYLHKML
jgi:hypothetical protein